MKITKQILLSVIFTLVLSACKKDKLAGDNTVLIGTWASIPLACGCCTSIGIPHDPALKLELLERGRYKLYQNGKKVEAGRLLDIDGSITFKCLDLGKKYFLNGRKIVTFNNDTLNIDHSCEKEYVYTLVKN